MSYGPDILPHPTPVPGLLAFRFVVLTGRRILAQGDWETRLEGRVSNKVAPFPTTEGKIVCVCGGGKQSGQGEGSFFNPGGQARTLAPSTRKTDEVHGCSLGGPQVCREVDNQVLDSA